MVKYYHNTENIKKTKNKNETITLRLESEILDSLREEARRKDVSVNTLVRQVTKQHTSWHSRAAEAGFIYVRKVLMTKLLESQDDDQIKSIAKYVALSSKDFLLVLESDYNTRSALVMIETWMSISGFSYTHDTKDLDYSHRLHAFILLHHMGRKWSLYLAELYKNLFEEFEIRNIKFHMTDHTLAFEMTVPIDEDNSSGKNEIDY
jgi:predicted DNA-binding ribbon-helix-helix protein